MFRGGGGGGAGKNCYLFFRELGSNAYFFRGTGEQAHSFGDLASTAKK